MLSSPVVLKSSAAAPLAVLLLPVVLFRAREAVRRVLKAGGVAPERGTPLAVFSLPVVLLKSAENRWPCCAAGGVVQERRTPLAVLLLPVVLLRSARKPSAVFRLPVVL